MREYLRKLKDQEKEVQFLNKRSKKTEKSREKSLKVIEEIISKMKAMYF